VTDGFTYPTRPLRQLQQDLRALAGIIILLLWLFLTAFVVLVGAELNTEMELQTAEDTTAGPEQPSVNARRMPADHVAAAP
jgi:membrane protein